MTPNGEKEVCHYLAIKKLSTLLRRITSKHCCLHCLYSFRSENKVKLH